MKRTPIADKNITLCYHCGEPCVEKDFRLEDYSFCCFGCQTVYEILRDHDMGNYYTLESHPGTFRESDSVDFDCLDTPEIGQPFLLFNSPSLSRLKFFVPNIHCVSCIWLLENLGHFNSAIFKSEVNFGAKQVTVDFNPEEIRLSEIAILLDSLGYTPQLQGRAVEQEAEVDYGLITRLAVAGFCFGNVMLFSFPEYLGMGDSSEWKPFFSWLSVGLSLPVLLYCGHDYFVSALSGVRHRQLNIDVPIAIGLFVLFGRSLWEVLSGYGQGYWDSFTGLVFFLLIGKWFQHKTYESLSFDRDYRSYFPLAIKTWDGTNWQSMAIHKLEVDDMIKVRNGEIIPTDGTMIDAEAFVDYSFVTGESKPVKLGQGDWVYAGGRLIGSPCRFLITKKTAQSYLTSLWNRDVFQQEQKRSFTTIIDKTARVFTWVVLSIALLTGVYWFFVDQQELWLSVTAVLIVACPCALALSVPFTYGSMLRVFGRHQMYLKSTGVIEKMADIDSVVFDKTGTVTYGSAPEIQCEGKITPSDFSRIKLLASYSTHPLSRLIDRYIREEPSGALTDFEEHPGMGIQGKVDGIFMRLGSAAFVGLNPISSKNQGSVVYVSIEDNILGYFKLRISVRQGVHQMLMKLGRRCKGLLSGDNPSDKDQIGYLFPEGTSLLFDQGPHEKMDFIQNLQSQHAKVMMVGDGLNDAGALKQSDVGLAVTDDTGVFTPSCDGILQGNRVQDLHLFLQLARDSRWILKAAFLISFAYNAVAIGFAFLGLLTPLLAAILMPLSSISVVAFATLAVNGAAAWRFGHAKKSWYSDYAIKEQIRATC